MKPHSDDPVLDELEPDEVDSFSTSLAPINHHGLMSFGPIHRFFCLSLLLTAATLMRFFFAK
jgi:hypothetical protein